ncbi:hypothetical protein, partial [Nonomuraea lactucae]|uniref:hypothetical protein n=1 Tax=Nonomuraea lactucae TaxID=2249762 RepID=UPI0013B42EDF
ALRSAAGPAVLGVLGGVAATVGPAAGAALGGAMVAGIGVRLAALGTQSLFFVQDVEKSWSAAEKRRVEAANKQANELRAQFKELGRDLTLAMQESSRPMLSVLDEVRVQARGVAKDVAPAMSEGFDRARVPMEQFVRDLGAGLKELGDAIPSLMGGFSDVLGQIDIKGFLSDLGAAFDDLGRAVSANRGTIGAVLNGLLDTIPLAIAGLGKVVEFFGILGLAVIRSAATISERMAGTIGVITGIGTRVLEVTRTIGQALANVPGMEEFGRRIVQASDAGIKKLQDFQRQADEASKAVRLKADIFELQQNIDKALTLLDDPNLSKERRAQIGAEIGRLLAAKGQAILELGDPKLVAEYKSEITTEIDALKSRLADARKELKDPELTKERKSRLKAEIGELVEGVKRAQQALESVKDKTVTIRVRTEQQEFAARASMRKAAGGIQSGDGRIQYMAAGGMTGSSSMSPPPPMIRKQPTFIAGSQTVFAEAGREAYIPYAAQYRDRAIKILGAVAQDFGLAVYNEDAQKQVTTLSTGLQATNASLSTSLADATRELDVTLGGSGSLTQAVSQVGMVGGQMSQAWTAGSQALGSAVTSASHGMSDSVSNLGDVVGISADMVVVSTERVADAALTVADVLDKALSAVLSKAGGGTKTRTSSTSSDKYGLGSAGSVIPPKPGSKPKAAPSKYGLGSAGAVIGPKPNLKPKSNPADMVAGHNSSSYIVTSGDHLTNYSRISVPQMASRGGGSSSYGGSGGGNVASMEAVSQQLATVVDRIDKMERRSPLNIEHFHTTEQMSAEEIGARLATRIGSRG